MRQLQTTNSWVWKAAKRYPPVTGTIVVCYLVLRELDSDWSRWVALALAVPLGIVLKFMVVYALRGAGALLRRIGDVNTPPAE